MPVQSATAKTNGTPVVGSDLSLTLADVLFKQGALDEARMKQIKLAEVQTGKTQEEIIKSQRLVDETTLTVAKAELYNVPYIDITMVPVSPEALSTISQEVAARFRIFPVSVDSVNKQIVVAMADPLDLTAIEFIEQKTGLLVKPHAAEPSKIDTLVSTGYATSLAKEVSEALREVST